MAEWRSLPSGKWTVLGIPLRCFAWVGVDMRGATSPFVLTTRGSLTLSLGGVGLATTADRVAACPR